MEKVTVDYNGEHSALRKNFQDLNRELFKYRNIFKYKFNSNANDRIDIFLEDDFIEKLFEFIERQNELLIKLIREFRNELEKIEHNNKLNQDNNLFMINKLSEKITQKDQELYEKQIEIETLNLQLERYSQIKQNNQEDLLTENKFLDAQKNSEEEKEKYEDNIYHTFSINEECLKSGDAKLFICANKDTIKNNSIHEKSTSLEINETSENFKIKGDIKQINFSSCNSKKKINTPISYSHNQINNIYNNNYNFNEKVNIKNFLTKIDPADDYNKYNEIITNDSINNQIPKITKKIGFNYKDILPRYNRMYLDKDTSHQILNNSVNYKSKEKSRDNSNNNSAAKNLNKSKENNQESNKSTDKNKIKFDLVHKTFEHSKKDSNVETKKNLNSFAIPNAIPKHRRILSTQQELNKSRDSDKSKEKLYNSSVNGEKLSNPTQKLLSKYYEILTNYNNKVKKEVNTSFYKEKKDLNSSINESHSNYSCSTSRSIDKFLNSNGSNNDPKYESKSKQTHRLDKK